MTIDSTQLSLSYPLEHFLRQQQGSFAARPETSFTTALKEQGIHLSGTGADLLGGVRDMNFVCAQKPCHQTLQKLHTLATSHFGPSVQIQST